MYDYLRGVKRWPVTDTRGQKLPWDFEVVPQPGILWRLDVKADHWMDETGRLPYETHHEYPDGSTKPGWGRIAELDVVAVVAMGKQGVRGSHRCVLVQRPAMHLDQAFKALVYRKTWDLPGGR